MLTAKYKNSIINCFDGKYDKEMLKLLDDKKLLLCPICDKPYTYCHGKIVTPYFRHKNNSDCTNKYTEGETEEHLKGKIALYNWINKQDGVTNVVLEPWIKKTKQIPDIGFKYNGNPFVIEYQCSPVSDDFHERRRLYKSIGVTDIWILGTDKYLEKSEVGKKFNTKEIEHHCRYYFDSSYNIFIFSEIQPLPYLYFNGCNDGYYNKGNRMALPPDLIWVRDKRYSKKLKGNFMFIGLDFVRFNKNRFVINNEAYDKTADALNNDKLKMTYPFYLCGANMQNNKEIENNEFNKTRTRNHNQL